jgi:CRP/FNR family transcriptional regulator, anaerobic regulatory protein
MLEALISQLNALVHFSDDELDRLKDMLEKVSLKKGDHFLKIGQVCRYMAYVESGLMMHYHLHDGIEIPVDFQGEGEWVSYLKSLMSGTASDMGIKTLEDVTLFRLSADNLNWLVEMEPAKVMKIKNYYTEQSFFKNTQHSADMAMLNAKQRYQKFVRENAALHNRIPQYYIAAYLGIKPQSLSRIRKEG